MSAANNTNPSMVRAEKLSKWAKEPSVMDLKSDLEAAKPSHDAWLFKVRKWNDLRNVTGSAKPKVVRGRSSVEPKLIRRQAEWRYAALSEPFLSADKMWKMDPSTFEDVQAAKQNELVANYQFRTKINRVKFIDEYSRTAVDEGTVIVRLGWNRKTKLVPTQVPVFTHYAVESQEEVDMLQQAQALKASDPRGYQTQTTEELRAAVDYLEETGQPTVAVITGSQVQEIEQIQQNHPTLEVMDPDNVFIDPSCQGDIDKAKFVIVSFETSKADLIKDGRYKNLDAVNWSGNTVLASPDHATRTPGDFNFKDDLRKRIVAYEYWGYYDVEGKDELTPIVATWVGDVMIRLEANPFPDEKPPFVVVPYMPVKRALHGEPDAEILEDNQKVLGAVTRGMIDLMGRSANSQQGFAKGFLDVTNKRRFEQGLDYEYNPGAGDPRVSVFQHTYPEIPNSAITMLQLQNNDAESLSGVKSFSGGMSGEAYGKVAAGIRGLLDASAKREMNILRRLAQGMKEIGTKIVAMNGAFLSEKEVVRITNEEYVEILREDLAGNFDIVVDIATPEVDQAKAEELAMMLQTLGPSAPFEQVSMILAEIAELRRMPALAKKIREFKPTPDPLAEKIKELEVQKLQMEIAKLQSEVQFNNAKARAQTSKADLDDLDYVEQETGTKHARDLDIVAEQAKSNQDLAVTKGLLTPRKDGEGSPDIEAAIGYRQLSDRLG